MLVLAGSAAAGDAPRGQQLFRAGCASCHGLNGEGVRNQGPSLRGAGAAAADFYLSTGRMPLDDPGSEPVRGRPAYSDADIDALVAYVASLGGPPIPRPDLSRASVSDGMRLFTQNCAACHQIQGRGGVVTGGFSPPLLDATTTQIAEAVRIGPYVMPAFDRNQLSDRELASIIRYVKETRHPDDRGGWGLFEIGPVPEGMVTWLLATALLVLVIRLLGERTRE